ncbi:MAG: hypothetical protein ACXWK8_13530, partial [Myxococcaceae bacterium]
MTVYTQDGEKLGKVVAVDDAVLFVEQGFFFPREYGFRFDDVADVRDDGVHLRLTKEASSSALVHDVGGLGRSRPSAVSEDREAKASGLTPDPRERGADAPGDRHSGRTGKRVVGTGTEPSLRVDQAEPIIEEVEEELAIARPKGGDDGDLEPADGTPRTD